MTASVQHAQHLREMAAQRLKKAQAWLSSIRANPPRPYSPSALILAEQAVDDAQRLLETTDRNLAAARRAGPPQPRAARNHIRRTQPR